MRIAALALIVATAGTTLALAQDAPKTESKPDRATEAKPARGDAAAEKLLKRAWERVQSAEAAGLQRLSAAAKITVDAKSLGMGEMSFEGDLLWKKGAPALWYAEEDPDAEPNPMGNLSDRARDVFGPYLGYVTGFEAWDAKFKDASFAMGELIKDDKGEKKADRVVVTFPGDVREDYAVADNRIIARQSKVTVGDSASTMEIHYTYEDTGKKLRLSKMTASTKVDTSGLPGGEGADPADSEGSLDGSIEIKKYGKAGEYEIALELAGVMVFKAMGQSLEFPVKLVLSDARVNKDVTDEELKPLDPPAPEPAPAPADPKPEPAPEPAPKD